MNIFTVPFLSNPLVKSLCRGESYRWIYTPVNAGRNVCSMAKSQLCIRLMCVCVCVKVIYRCRSISFFHSHQFYLLIRVRHIEIIWKMNYVYSVSENQYKGRLLTCGGKKDEICRLLFRLLSAHSSFRDHCRKGMISGKLCF